MNSFSPSSTAGPFATLDILSEYCASIPSPRPSNGLHILSPQAIGLGILIRCPDTNSLSILSPLAMRRASPTLGVPRAQAPLCRRVKQGAGPLMARSHAAPATQRPAPRQVSIAPPPSKYAGLGHGLPKHLHANSRGYRRPAARSAITRISSVTQCGSSISQLLSIVSYPRALLKAMRVASASPSPTPLVESLKAGRSNLNGICVAVAQLVNRKQTEGKTGPAGVENPEIERCGEVAVHVSVERCSQVL
ncbi:hypothetical protein DFH06DRAFT_1130683 [Mycena polygramma]|nr:hypothetical protein DFH06DRAFT_1130683 [Mycena polygramma]